MLCVCVLTCNAEQTSNCIDTHTYTEVLPLHTLSHVRSRLPPLTPTCTQKHTQTHRHTDTHTHTHTHTHKKHTQTHTTTCKQMKYLVLRAYWQKSGAHSKPGDKTNHTRTILLAWNEGNMRTQLRCFARTCDEKNGSSRVLRKWEPQTHW
jgi:hypothetical protein